MKRFDIVAIGEPMIEFNEVDRDGEALFLPGHGGDTSNAIIAAARQGARTAYWTALGNDPFGESFLELWKAEGVDAADVVIREGGRTGIYVVTHGPQGHAFSYYRAGSAASLIEPREVPELLLADTRILHVSGISQAISTTACDAVFHALRLAKKRGAKISYDTNLRLRLWPLDRARAVIKEAVSIADIARPSVDDAAQLFGTEDPDAICDAFLELGPEVVALTLGAAGSMVATRERRERFPSIKVDAVDATGAGDTYGGSFLAEYLRTGDAFAAGRYATVAAALATEGYGAVAPMPRRADVEARLAASR